ncbi:porin [Caballeronia sp. LjRoot34]|uniref:porin n=1 Tax=Caballeronia sp. LjRoot34 TaxID=3342325 RepID=UPI003ECECE0F
MITCAQAQSSVTLAGLLGLGVSYTNNAGNGVRYQESGTHAVPFFVLSGKEMIDSDTSAIFRFSQYAFLNTGTSTPFESYVGLSSLSKGTLTLGSMYDLLADAVPFTSERYTSLLATHPGNLDRTVGNSLNNTVKYKSPTLSGFQFGAMYGFGQADSTTNTGRVVGVDVNYAGGPFQAVLIWESVNSVPYAPALKLGVTELYGINFSKTPAATINQNQNTGTLGLAYVDNGWRVMGNYSYTRLTAVGESETAQTIDVGAYKYVMPDLRIGGGYSYTKLDTYKWNQFHAHVDYALSKRTSLYVLGVLQVAGSGQLAVMRNQPVASASRQLVLEAGMTHAF